MVSLQSPTSGKRWSRSFSSQPSGLRTCSECIGFLTLCGRHTRPQPDDRSTPRSDANLNERLTTHKNPPMDTPAESRIMCMPEFARRSGAVLAYVTLLTAALPVEAIEVSGRVEIEPRVFFHSPEHSFQNHHGISLAIEPEFYFPFQDDRRSLVFTPFLRVDSADGRRSHFDVRELTYQWVFDDLELRAGVGRVFWGRH